MRLQSNFWWYGLRGCYFCGSLFPLSEGLCQVCARDLWSWAPDEQLYIQDLEDQEVASLFQWIPGQQQVLSFLILALKGAHGGRAWQYFAEEFWRRYLSTQEPFSKRVLLVPSPGQEGRRDHAFLFTEGLAKASGVQICNCLKRDSMAGKAQKTKSRQQRARVSFQWAENFSLAEFRARASDMKIVFIDDVVTTGATAKAAWKTLGKPEDFTIWSLAQRSLSCGASTSLV
jgi:predicted amidophosphoribosyltransferase